ncbi:zinc-dependent alcohol dehydrogenase [Phytoactinopolyspora limicola]|uniref:zinc-dependent alcohol dehydrogenase n=1 Tax=Phytoactinopolyspora limicola TaxID=2715536 RepID=UPI0014082542|nr:alcohol dehydrogenase catalytic domain-containing protein [Phytoactinopolyspora limicola]
MTTSRTTSRHVLFAAPDRIEIDETPVPDPADGDMLVRVRRVGICATDLHLLAGHIGEPFPLVPGHEFVGEVAAMGVAAGADRGVGVGDHVAVEMSLPCRSCPRCREGRYNLCDRDDPAAGLDRGRQYGVNIPRTVAPGLWGGYAQYLTVPAEAIVHHIPHHVPWDVAALAEPLAVAYRAIARAGVRPGESVAVIGPGPVGLLTAAAARSAGAGRVVAVGTRQNRLDLARRFGADHTINGRERDVREALVDDAGGLCDVVIEAAGRVEAQQQAVGLVRRGGRVVLAGACGAGASVTFRADEDLLTREIDVLPSFLSAGGFEPAITLLARAELPFAALVTHRFGLDDVAAAYDVIERRDQDVIKVVLDPWSTDGFTRS